MTAVLAVAALARQVSVWRCPPFSSDHSVNDAKQLALNLGSEFQIVPIKDIHDAYERSRRFCRTETGCGGGKSPGPRARRDPDGDSNKFNHLLLTTAQKRNRRRLLHALWHMWRRACGDQRRAQERWSGKVGAGSDGSRAVKSFRKAASKKSLANPVESDDQDSLPPYEVLDAICIGMSKGKRRRRNHRRGFRRCDGLRVIKLIDRQRIQKTAGGAGLKVTAGRLIWPA